MTKGKWIMAPGGSVDFCRRASSVRILKTSPLCEIVLSLAYCSRFSSRPAHAHPRRDRLRHPDSRQWRRRGRDSEHAGARRATRQSSRQRFDAQKDVPSLSQPSTITTFRGSQPWPDPACRAGRGRSLLDQQEPWSPSAFAMKAGDSFRDCSSETAGLWSAKKAIGIQSWSTTGVTCVSK